MLKHVVIRTSCLFLLFLLASCTSSSDGPKVNINEGRWQITAEIKMANLPFQMPPTSYTTCLTQEDLIPRPGMEKEKNGCEVTSHEVDGDTVTWTITCQGDNGTMVSDGSITYSGDTFSGRIVTNLPGAGETEQILTGKRIGDCE
nr:DUF3617 family protein [uncultured Desulfuromonas sp.]